MSRDLDGELSEFESALLAAHLERCPSCRAFAQGAAAVTEQLRGTELVPLVRPISLPKRRRVVLSPARLATAAAACAAMAGLSAGVALKPFSTTDTRTPVEAVQNVDDQVANLRLLKVAQFRPRAFIVSPKPRDLPTG